MEWLETTELAGIEQVRAGDADAFRLLVERYRRAIFRLTYRMTGNEQDAEDMVQETFSTGVSADPQLRFESCVRHLALPNRDQLLARECCWDGGGSCRCSLEGDHTAQAGGRSDKLESSGRVAVLIRVENKQVGKIRVYAENCELDAGGLPVHWLTDVLPKDEGVPLLIQTARNNRNPEVRKQAMFWLGQSQDVRALAFFEEVLKGR